MNIRKPIDYTTLFEAVDRAVNAVLPQMELYREIGRLVSERPEKGAAVAVAEHLQSAYPEVNGFSPRNLRRMRKFANTYESSTEILQEAMRLGWTQNVVILEAELTIEQRAWYIKAALEYGWSKQTLSRKIAENAHTQDSDVEKTTSSDDMLSAKDVQQTHVPSERKTCPRIKAAEREGRCTEKLTLEEAEQSNGMAPAREHRKQRELPVRDDGAPVKDIYAILLHTYGVCTKIKTERNPERNLSAEYKLATSFCLNHERTLALRSCMMPESENVWPIINVAFQRLQTPRQPGRIVLN